jgi:hypothetical protein
MRLKNIVITFLILIIFVVGVLVIFKKSKNKGLVVPTATPSIQQKIESKFKGLTIPADAEKVELKDVSGGNGMGLAMRGEILADLPILTEGQFYQAWLEKDGKEVLIGKLEIAKGGWILNYDSSKYPGYNKVIITLGTTHILEGSF